ncbi:MAG: EAL domain-containing protein [Lachnospiraceae bacterium]|nr:EAL domain-containing protein [Lachnospiraceae bacterium]
MQYNINFDIAAIFVCLFSIYCVIAKKGLVRAQNRVLLGLCIMNLACTVFDILAVLSLQEDSVIPLCICYALNLCYFLLHNAVPLVCLLYLGHLTGENFKYSPYYYTGVGFPYLLLVIGLLTNIQHHFLFSITKDRIYIRETGFFLLYLVAAIYLIAIVVKLFKYRISMDPTRRWMLLFYLSSSIIALCVEYFYPSALVELFFQAVSILGVIFTIDNLREISCDDANAYNRTALVEDLNILFSSKQDFLVLVVKVPKLIDFIPSIGLTPVARILYDISEFLHALPGVELYHCGEGRFVLTHLEISKRDLLLNQITNRFREPWAYQQIETHLNAEICYAESPAEITSIDDIYTILQSPIKESVNLTGTTYCYDFQRYLRENQVHAALQKALKNRSFEIYYQPIMDVKHQAIHSAEALIRLNDDTLGYVSPEEFIPIAERRGCIIEIGDFVMEEVCRFICENDIKDYGIQFIDINLSAYQCMDQKIAGRFLDLMKKYHINPNQISFELTEAAINRNLSLIPVLIERFAKRGVQFSLDDYGTGNSNISTIFALPFSTVKLDKNVLWAAEKNHKNLEILKNIMKLVKSFHLKLLIEGIETEHQMNWLLENDCDYCQGYYFSRALPEGDFLKFISRFNHIEL